MNKTKEQKDTARPFLKWAGGKTQLIGEIEKRLPDGMFTGAIETYVEPFVGGGAVFFHVAQTCKKVKNFYLFDVNMDLVNCYKQIKRDVDFVINELLVMQDDFLKLNDSRREKYFYEVREKFNEEKAKGLTGKIAARLIFLNKTCFNGLHRVNRKGEFNVPSGRYANPKICDKNNLLRVSRVLQKAEIICGDFTQSREYIDDKTFVYFDPPYRPISKTASFTSYSKEDFTEDEQIRLAEFCRLIELMGARFLLSNSDPKNEDPQEQVGIAMGSETLLINQPCGPQLEYRVKAVSVGGESIPSNMVTVVL